MPTGNMNSGFARSAVVARRLVESGVSAVELSLGGWDTHGQNFNALATRQLPQLDRAMGTLVKDLVDRGLWQNTVLVWMGEFARTPRINQNAGRDHWARCWSIVVGGGAIKGGQAYGSTDAGRHGGGRRTRPASAKSSPRIYRGLGIDPDHAGPRQHRPAVRHRRPLQQPSEPANRPASVSGHW